MKRRIRTRRLSPDISGPEGRGRGRGGEGRGRGGEGRGGGGERSGREKRDNNTHFTTIALALKMGVVSIINSETQNYLL